MTTVHERIRRSALGGVVALLSAHAALAQSRVCDPGSSDSTSAASWQTPLDRPVTAHMTGVALRDALDRVAASAKLRLSYSTELIPLDRVVCLAGDATPVGKLLAELLAGTNVVATAVGGDQVVLAPRAPGADRPVAPEMAPSMGVLDRVVVTGSAMGAPERELTVALNVLSGRQLARDNANTLSTALDGFVPGVWSWAQSPASMLSSYASIRGASSFGLSYPKIYIDGIEVANPLLISRFAPEAIDRIEVIRGPQGSALYGTDAISGVVNIVTRHEGATADGEHTSVRSSAGLTTSAYGPNVLSQDHALSIVSGSSTRSADLHVSGGSVGDFIPDGHSRNLLATGSTRVVGTRSTISLTARYFTEQAGGASSPLLAHSAPPQGGGSPSLNAPDSLPQSIHEYTVGTTATFVSNDRWTQSLVMGVDGYKLANVQTDVAPIPSAADSALQRAQGGADRGTFRASSVLRLGSGEATPLTLTMSAEHGVYRATTERYLPTTSGSAGTPTPFQKTEVVAWQSSTGITTQANAALNNSFFLTGGVRVERDSRLPGNKTAAFPMLGTAAVGDYGPFTVKLRGAYGEGIRPPSTFSHSNLWQNAYGATAQPSLGAEKQSGTEAGLDVLLRHAWSFRVTRFDQRASGLIQQVVVPADSSPMSHRVRYELENVGEISNSGWEMETSTNVSRLSVLGTLSFVDSRVQKLANGYNGDLMRGDRMLQVPARTGSLNLSWLGDGWVGSIGGSRALDWINYDELALATAYLSGVHSAHDLSGHQLRQYWRTYDGGLRVRASASRDIRDMFTVEISGDNLFNYQRNEPDNITVLPGRTVMTGIRLRF